MNFPITFGRIKLALSIHRNTKTSAMNDTYCQFGLHQTRRHFFRDCQIGLGSLALGQLLANETRASYAQPLSPIVGSHFKATPQNVIFLHMAGSPPHLDLLDYKPALVRRTGQSCPDEYLSGRRFAFTTGVPKLLGTPRKVQQFGESGNWFSDALPELSKLADDVTIGKSMNTEQFNHAPAQLMLYTGSPRVGRPSLGSWITYGKIDPTCASYKQQITSMVDSMAVECNMSRSMSRRVGHGKTN